MKPPKAVSLPEVVGAAPIPDAAVVSFLKALQQLLLTETPADRDIALTEHLDRKKLDFSLDSLHEIDRYLTSVHDNTQAVSGLPLLSTICAIAMYIGEIVRREAPAKHYKWVRVGELCGISGETTISYPDLGAVRALRARDGDMCMPSRAVLRIILRGSKAPSIYSFVRAALEPADVVAQPASLRAHET